MKDPVSLNPDVKALLDGAYDKKAAVELARQTAEADRIAKERENLVEGARYLEQVVRPGLDVLREYLSGRGTAAEVQHTLTNGHTSELRLVWGRAVRHAIGGRQTNAQQSTFKVSLVPGGKLLAASALLGEEFETHNPAPDPLTTEWVQTEAAKVIKRSVVP